MKTDHCWKLLKASLIGVGLCFTGFLLTSCAVTPKKPPETPAPIAVLSPKELMEKYAKEGAVNKPRPPLADLSPIVPLEPQMATETALPFEKKLFSMEVIDEPLGNVLLGLAMAADLNLILGQDVNRNEPVSLKINNLPLNIALDTIISVHDYYYTIQKSILRVEGLKTQFFSVDYPLVYSIPKSETGGDVLGGGGGGAGGGSNTAISSSGLTGEFSLEVKVDDQESLDIWKKIEEALRPSKQGKGGLLSDQGKAEVSRLSGTIVVTDRPKNLKTVTQFIDCINQALHRQVVIEAKIVEVTLNKGHSYGINWDMLRKTSGFGDLEVSQNVWQGAGALTLGFFDTAGSITGQAVLNALATQGDVNVLSSPRLNVINNQSALISVGRVIPYIDLTITTTEDEVDGDIIVRTSSVPVIARTLEGVTLGITAQISEDGMTTLHIVPIITEQSGSKSFSIQDQTFEVPIFSVRESDTMVTVGNQQTIVIGGLIQEKTDDTVTKIPFLGDIPLLKTVFSAQSREASKTELVLMLTTTVVN